MKGKRAEQGEDDRDKSGGDLILKKDPSVVRDQGKAL
jgi:hypothetical protein